MEVDDYWQILLHLKNPQPEIVDPVPRLGWVQSWNIANSMCRYLQLEINPATPCERCGATPTRLYAAHTCYELEKNNPFNPNVERPFCEKCGEEWDEYWEDMWAEYYRGLI